MIEIATIFGHRKMKACALLHGSVFESTIPTIGERGYTWEKLILWSNCRGKDHGESGAELAPGEKQAIKFLELCMELDPEKRMTANEALEHEFLSEASSPALEEDEMEVLG